jgi:polyhydroxyalkanoate synthesis regulator phasin
MEDVLKLILDKLNTIESEVKHTNQRIDGLEQKIDSLENMMVKHSNDQTRLVVEAIESLENRLAGRMERMETRQAKLTVKVDVLEADVSILRQKLID